jgi:hypothetical protein
MNVKSAKYQYMVALLLYLFAGQSFGLVAQTNHEWREFSSTENRFSVSLPGNPPRLSRIAVERYRVKRVSNSPGILEGK